MTLAVGQSQRCPLMRLGLLFLSLQETTHNFPGIGFGYFLKSTASFGAIAESSGFCRIPEPLQRMRCKLSLAISRLSKIPLAVRGRRVATGEVYWAIGLYGPEALRYLRAKGCRIV